MNNAADGSLCTPTDAPARRSASRGQQAILDASALIVGVGGLGSPAAMYLAAAGIGKLILSDYDIVETSNLQRQIIHREAAVGENKVDSGKQHPQCELNTDCDVEVVRLSAGWRGVDAG